MMTPEEGARQRRAIQRQIDHGHRREAREGLRRLRGELRAAHTQRRGAIDEAKSACRTERLALREKAHARRRATLAVLRETYAKERADARAVCLARRAEACAGTKDPIERARSQWDAERRYQADLRRIEQGNRERHREAHRTHASERRSESDDVVRSNIPPDFVALFERVKRSIKGSSRESRTEAFLRYVEENPRELLTSLEDDSERLVRELEEQRDRAERALRPTRKATASSATTPDQAVPF
jgi:hypothetical protein